MSELDNLIQQTLDAEDRELMKRFEERGMFGQVFGMFEGKLGWMARLMFVIGTVVFAVGSYAAWKFATISDLTIAMRWAALAWACYMTMVVLKIWSYIRMGNNELSREIKRLELQIARLQSRLEK